MIRRTLQSSLNTALTTRLIPSDYWDDSFMAPLASQFLMTHPRHSNDSHRRTNPIAVICSNVIFTCAVCGYVIGQHAVQELIVALPPTSYVLDIDMEGFVVTRLTNMSDPLWQYKIGPNLADKWSMHFKHFHTREATNPSNAVYVFSTIYSVHGQSGMWRLGLRHSLLILLSTIALLVTHRVWLISVFKTALVGFS